MSTTVDPSNAVTVPAPAANNGAFLRDDLTWYALVATTIGYINGGFPFLTTVDGALNYLLAKGAPPVFINDPDDAEQLVIPGPAGIRGQTGLPGATIFADPDEPEVFSIPGNQGNTGGTGATGAVGPIGPALFFVPDAEWEAPPMVPGNTGNTGGVGPTGAIGPVGPALFVVPDAEYEEPPMIPGPTGGAGVAGSTGSAGATGPGVYLPVDAEEPEASVPAGLGNPVSLATGVSGTLPPAYGGAILRGLKPTWVTAATISMAAGSVLDSTDTTMMRTTGATTVDISTNGLNGCAQSGNQTGTISASASTTISGSGTSFSSLFQAGDVIWPATGGASLARVVVSVTNNTSLVVNASVTIASQAFKRGGEAAASATYFAYYHVYMISDGATPGFVLSTRNVANGDTLVDLPSGYTLSKQLPLSLGNNSSSNLTEFYVDGDGPQMRYVHLFDRTSLVTNGSSTGIAVDASLSGMPPTSRTALCSFEMVVSTAINGTETLTIRRLSGDSTNQFTIAQRGDGARPYRNAAVANISTTATQKFWYGVDTNTDNANIVLMGYTVDQVPL